MLAIHRADRGLLHWGRHCSVSISVQLWSLFKSICLFYVCTQNQLSGFQHRLGHSYNKWKFQASDSPELLCITAVLWTVLKAIESDSEHRAGRQLLDRDPIGTLLQMVQGAFSVKSFCQLCVGTGSWRKTLHRVSNAAAALTPCSQLFFLCYERCLSITVYAYTEEWQL